MQDWKLRRLECIKQQIQGAFLLPHSKSDAFNYVISTNDPTKYVRLENKEEKFVNWAGWGYNDDDDDHNDNNTARMMMTVMATMTR